LRVQYPISGKYCESWTVVMALREIISNMLDSRGLYRCYYKNRKAVFEDAGPGFDKRCLGLGEGEDKTDDQIGQFGEGMKLAMLVFARKGIKAHIKTSGFETTKISLEDTGLGFDGLTMEIEDSDADNGTIVTVSCKKRDFNKAVGMFIGVTDSEDWRRPYEMPEPGIYKPSDGEKPGVYVSGVLVDGNKKWTLQYVLPAYMGKTAMNRDRTQLSSHDLQSAMANLLRTVTDDDVVATILDGVFRRVNEFRFVDEYSIRGMPNLNLSRFILLALAGYDEVDDPKTVVLADARATVHRELEERGYVVIPSTKFKGASDIACDLFEMASNVFKAVRDTEKEDGEFVIVDESELSARNRAKLKEAKKLVDKYLQVGFVVTPSDRYTSIKEIY